MYQVLALKFRPQLFEEVVGQEHITTVIKNAIDASRIPHAFIFSGPRGVGKTSVARILAKALNCEKGPTQNPCNKCIRCTEITTSRAVDVFEIDAASHTGVDNIREIIENARYAPASARHKVFIIDEVHMLSKSAFNALLKTLEEPPSHVIFIMATTELNKIPPTVLSRCQRYDFRRIPVADIVFHLTIIAGKENIHITDDAIMTIALQADGSMRDAQGILEHVAATNVKEVTLDTIESLLGMVGRTTIHELLTALVNRDTLSVLGLIDTIYQYGQDLNQVYRSLLEQFRNMMVLKVGYDILMLPQEAKAFLQDLIKDISFEEIHRNLSILIRSEETFKYSALPKITLDTILLRIISAPSIVDLEQLIHAISSGRPNIPEHPTIPVQDKAKKPITNIPKTWDGFITYVKDHDAPLYAVLSKVSSATVEDNEIVITCPTSSLIDHVEKMLQDVKKKVAAFFQKDFTIRLEKKENGATQNGVNGKGLSNLRAEAMQSSLVREILAEFNGTITDIKAKE